MENRAATSMQNDLILAKVSKHLPTMDIVALRQTCKFWNQVLVAHSFRARHEPIGVIRLGHGDRGPQRKRGLATYNRLMRSTLEIPFGAYNIHVEGGWRWSESLKKFLDVYGNSVRSLRFKIPTDSTDDTTPNLISTLRRALSRGKLLELNRLELHNFHGRGSATESEDDDARPPLSELPNLNLLVLNYAMGPIMSEFVGQVVQAATNLRSLKLMRGRGGCNPSYRWGANEVGLKALRDWQPRLGHLKELKTSGTLKLREIKILVELGRRTTNRLQLRIFSIGLHEDAYNQQSALLLQQFLATQAHELQKFKIGFHGIHAEGLPPLVIPEMDQLCEFSFETRRSQFVNGNLRDNFPRLQKLGVWFTGLEGVNFEEDLMAVSLPGVFQVKVHLDDLSDHIERWPIWLPSVTHCQMLIKDDMRTWDLCSVWTTWPAMETLCITYEQEGDLDNNDPLNLDEFLSGVPASRHRLLRKELLKLGPMTMPTLRVLLGRFKAMPGITDLSRLKKFVLKARLHSEAEMGNLTDIGGYFGLAMVGSTGGGHLQHVEIHARDWEDGDRRILVEISDECLQLIRESLRPVALINV